MLRDFQLLTKAVGNRYCRVSVFLRRLQQRRRIHELTARLVAFLHRVIALAHRFVALVDSCVLESTVFVALLISLIPLLIALGLHLVRDAHHFITLAFHRPNVPLARLDAGQGPGERRARLRQLPLPRLHPLVGVLHREPRGLQLLCDARDFGSQGLCFLGKPCVLSTQRVAFGDTIRQPLDVGVGGLYLVDDVEHVFDCAGCHDFYLTLPCRYGAATT